MYAKGMTTRQISDTIEEIYGFEVSDGMVSDITDRLLPQIEDWQNRPLDAVYPIAVRQQIERSTDFRRIFTLSLAGRRPFAEVEII